jgi:hypothetical protein
MEVMMSKKCPEVNLCVTQGDEKPYNLAFSSGAGALDITGATVTMTVKRTKTGDAAFPPKVVTSHTDAEAGKTTITLSGDDTDIDLGLYWYDIEISGGPIAKKTVMKGQLEITWQATED